MRGKKAKLLRKISKEMSVAFQEDWRKTYKRMKRNYRGLKRDGFFVGLEGLNQAE